MAVVTFYSQINLGLNKSHGLVLGGWSLASDTKLYNINIAILDQQTNGTLKVNTSKYISDAQTNGEGSVIVTDLNGDGVDDIFLAAFNDGPVVINKSSTAYLSNGVDNFTKISLNDSTISHSAILSKLNGVDTIVTAGYGGTSPFYQYDHTSGLITVNDWGNAPAAPNLLGGSSATTGDFNGDGNSEVVIVDFINYRPNSDIVLYQLNGTNIIGDPYILAPPYFNNKTQYLEYVSEYTRKTHCYRVRADDFNHDGKLDIVVECGIWSGSVGWQKSKLQMLQNEGDFYFNDVTDVLGSAFDEDSALADFSMQIVDIDHSGINSYLLALTNNQGAPGNYVMLNDGTGKLYDALHDEFISWGKQIKAYLKATGGFYFSDNQYPQLIAYQTTSGLINFVAEIPSYANNQITFLNLPVEYNPTTDYTEAMVLEDRNNSQLIRTFAGNDKIYDVNQSHSATNINGGLGSDTCVYSGLSANYTITKTSTGYTIQDTAGLYGADTIVNIEKLQFTDQTISIAPPIEGGAAKDKLTGTTDDDEMYGYAGNDTLTGLAGNDTLDGGTGDDSMTGGAGNDTYIADSIKDKIIEKTNEGTDTVITTATYTLANNVENLTLSGSSAINGTGNTVSNIVVGNDAANSINGGLGNDTLTGGTGNDTFVFNTKLGATNIDTITDFTSGTDKIAIDDAIFTKLRGDKNLSDNLYIQRIPGISTQDTNDYLFYDFESGQLYYDADGSVTKSAAVMIAIIGSATEIAATDFVII